MKDILWQDFYTYLVVDKKLKETKKNISAIKSKFKKLSKFFEKKDFNRNNLILFLADMKKSYSNAYLNKFITLSKYIASYLHIQDLDDFTYFTEKIKEVEILTEEEVKKLATLNYPYQRLAQERNYRDYVAIVFLYSTACRIGELEELLWSDILCSPIPHVIFKNTKNGDDTLIPITKNLHTLLQKLPKFTEKVFSSSNGFVFSRTEFTLNLKRRAKLLNIEKNIYPHIFRHSRLTHLVMLYKFPLAEVAKFARHADPKTTMRYTHPLLSELSPIAYSTPFEDTNKSLLELAEVAKQTVKRLFPRNDIYIKSQQDGIHIIVAI